MKFYVKQHEFYCGIDLHTQKMYLCILDDTGAIRLHRNINPIVANEIEVI